MQPCAHCHTLFSQRIVTQKFCSAQCRKISHYSKTIFSEKLCDLCGSPFLPKMKNARFCSRKCYVKAWPKLNREKWNAIRRQNRLDHIEKSRKKDRVYKDTYMRKMIGSRPWRKTMMSRQKDAAGRGLEFELTDEWAAARWTGFCEVTGLPFRTSGTEKGPHPYSASIDRIDQKIGYTQDNSRIVLWAINAFRGRGDDATMMEIARALVARGNNPQ